MSETLIGKAFTNSFSFPGGFVVQADKPIDDRLVVHSVASLTAANTFVSSTDNLLKAYNGMVVSVLETNEIYILTDVANITNINSWKKINVPQASSTDEGKLLTVEKVNVGTTESPVYKYEGRWVDAPSGLPTINGTSDANKILQVNAAGTGVTWVQNTHPKELPTIGASDANKILQVNAGGTGVTWVENTHPKELPTYTTVESGKVLTVSSDGTSTEWSTIDTELVKTVTTNELFTIATQGGSKPGQGSLKPGMKYRITDYVPAVNPDYTININGEECTIGTQPGIGFDIIVTASSESTLFEDVELVAKDGVTTTFDYTKYEAKYDLFGNTTSPDPKYAYITSSGTGVIYYMKDQYGNEASYDFENIFYFMPSNPGIYIHTFTGFKHGDLRQYGEIHNVRIKNSRINTLPGVVFEYANHYNGVPTYLDDVELNDCSDIYISCTNLHHAKISNSKSVYILMPNNNSIMKNPMFENLNISDNAKFNISASDEFILEFNPFSGFYVKNLNILPSVLQKRSINIGQIFLQMINIFMQGLIDTDIITKLNPTPDNGEWLLSLMNPETADMSLHILCGQNVPISVNNYDTLVYDAILNASKNVKSFDIFDGFDDSENVKNWSLEIPQFQSTATSVVELGI